MIPASAGCMRSVWLDQLEPTADSSKELLRGQTALSWLSIGADVGGMVGAVVGVLSLLVSLSALHTKGGRPSVNQSLDHPSRDMAGIAAVLFGIVAVAAWAVDLAGLRDTWLLVTAAGSACCALAIFTVSRIWRPISLPEPLRRILDEQIDEAEQPGYRFGSFFVTGLSKIYVTMRLQPAAPTIGTGRTAPRPFNLTEMMAVYRHGVVTAEPGAGKSTLLAHAARESASWWLDSRRKQLRRRSPFRNAIALRVPAAALVGHDFAGALAMTWSWAAEGVNRELFTRPIAPRITWLILVDGLDEILDPDERSSVLHKLNAQMSRSMSNYRVLVTSRPLPLGEVEELRGLDVGSFRLSPFSPADLERFTLIWFTARAKEGQEYSEATEARRFRANVQDAGLSALIHVPLLATMAVLVYERDRDAPLPTSRAELYHEFVSLLREGRVSGTTFTRLSRGRLPEEQDSETRIAGWLESRDSDLIAHLAAAHVDEPRRRLLSIATEWITRHAPESFGINVTTESSWIGILRSVLIATSLVIANGNEIEFIHPSIAEYIAAGSRTFNLARWRIEVRNEVTRSLALFTLARSDHSIEGIINDLLDGPEPDPISAGYIRLEGMISDIQQRRRVDDALVSELQGEERWRSLELLTQLASDPEVGPRLVGIARDVAEAPWLRVLAAHALADRDPVEGITLLRDTAAHHTLNRTEAARWATERLISMGVDLAYYIATNLGSATAGLDTYPPPALRHMALDSKSAWRLQAALQLGTNDDTGLAVLKDFATSSQYRWERLYATEALARASDPTGTAVLHELHWESEGLFRFYVALALIKCGETTGLDDIKTVAISLNPETLRGAREHKSPKKHTLHALSDAVQWYLLGRGFRAFEQRDLLAEQMYYSKDPQAECVQAISEMAKLNQPAGLAVVRELAERHEVEVEIRTVACVALARKAEVSDMSLLRRLATDEREPDELRCRLAVILAEKGDEAGVEVLRSLLVTSRAEAATPKSASVRGYPWNSLELAFRRSLEEKFRPARIKLLAATELLARGDAAGLHATRAIARDDKLPEYLRTDAAAAWADYAERSELPTLHRYITDPAVPARARCLSAMILDQRGDPAGPEMILELMLDEGLGTELRLELASIVLSRDEQPALATLHEICCHDETSLERRQSAVTSIGQHGTAAKWPVLQDLAANEEIDARIRLQANYWLMEHDSSAAWDNIHGLASHLHGDEELQYVIAQLLANRGDHMGLEMLRSLAESSAFDVAVDAGRDLSAYGHHEALNAIRAHVRARQIDMGERARYAWMLASKGEQIGLDVLQEMAARGESPGIARIKALLSRYTSLG